MDLYFVIFFYILDGINCQKNNVFVSLFYYHFFNGKKYVNFISHEHRTNEKKTASKLFYLLIDKTTTEKRRYKILQI